MKYDPNHQLFLFSKIYRFSSLSADFHRSMGLLCASFILIFFVCPTLYIFFLELGSELNLSFLIRFHYLWNGWWLSYVWPCYQFWLCSLCFALNYDGLMWYLDWDFSFISDTFIFLGTTFWVIDLGVFDYFFVGSVLSSF